MLVCTVKDRRERGDAVTRRRETRGRGEGETGRRGGDEERRGDEATPGTGSGRCRLFRTRLKHIKVQSGRVVYPPLVE
jgi:hypothetical protein